MGLDDKFNELKGKAKETVGDLTGNDRLEAEGKTDRLKAKGEGTVDDAKDKVSDATDSLKDKADGVKDSLDGDSER